MNCASHYLACNCREQKIATLVKAAIDAMVELDWMKNLTNISQEDRERMQQIVERGQAACEQLGNPMEIQHERAHV